ncbi:MAG TPA: hypothetical protein VE998_02310, partial [Terriglobales bacterium]|nr:hypothetical protein [Terriglobales bacterium]
MVALCLFTTAAAAQTHIRNGDWQLLPDANAQYQFGNLPNTGWRSVRVGLSWNAQFDDMRDFGGVGWYRTSIPAQPQGGKRVLLRFSACDYFCEVFLNGARIGQHEGGYTPFEFDISSRLRSGAASELIVRVTDPPRDPGRNQQLFPQFMYDELPHGKQNWYVQTGGLWQPVTVAERPAAYLKSVHVTAATSGDVEVTATWDPEREAHASLIIRDPAGAVVAEESKTASSRRSGVPAEEVFRVHVDNPSLWSPESPALYTAEIMQRVGSAVNDSAEVRFGFRSLESRGGRLYLNGRPFYMIGALDQDFYPATIYTPPSPEYLRDEMRKAKALGLNTLRCHIKICTPAYLD